MQGPAPSPAPSKTSTGIGGNGGLDATASRLVEARAAVNAESAAEPDKSQDAVMGDLSSMDSRQRFKEAAKQMKIDLTSKPDQMPISELNVLLKLMASGAMKEVEECTDLLEASMPTTATANKAVVTGLSTVALWNEKERERLEDVIALSKGNVTNFSIPEKIFLAAQASYNSSNKIVFNPQCSKCMPGNCTDHSPDEYQQEILLQIDHPSKLEEKFSNVVDKRIIVNKRKHETTRLKLARAIGPACSATKMEKDKYAPFPLAQFLECHTQSAWTAVANSWIRKPAVLDKYLEIAHGIVFYTNVYDNNAGMYGKAGLGMLTPILWSDAQKLSEQVGYLRHSACTEVSTSV